MIIPLNLIACAYLNSQLTKADNYCTASGWVIIPMKKKEQELSFWCKG